MKIKHLALFTIVVTYVLIVFGGYVASSNSGMGCGPEWPLCNGLFIPVLKGATLIEFTHRVIGAILVFLTLTLFFIIQRANVDTNVRRFAWVMSALLIIQVLLGAIVVILDLPSIVVSIHLVIAMIYLLTLISIWMKNKQTLKSKHTYTSLSASLHNSLLRHLNIVLVLLILTLAFGAYIKHQSYGLACGWFGCGETVLPVTKQQLLQTFHRGLALVSTIYILVLTYLSVANKWGSGLQKRLLIGTVTVLIQLILGVATIITSIDVSWAVLHLAVGTAVFAFISEARMYLGSTMVKTSMNDQKVVWQQQSLD